jgi:hypothetical protein
MGLPFDVVMSVYGRVHVPIDIAELRWRARPRDRLTYLGNGYELRFFRGGYGYP